MSKTKIVIAVTVCMFLFGCNLSDNNRVVFDSAAFDRARVAWEAQGITCYSFDIVMIPGSAYRVTVRNGEAVNVKLLYQEEAVEVEKTLEGLGFWDIPAFFGWIQDVYNEAWERDLGRGSTLYINVTYNADYNFPELIETSWRTRRPMDGLWSYTRISNFRPIEN